MIKKQFTNHVYYRNEKGRDFVVGDLHGMYEDLKYEMCKVNFDTMKDRLFCVGDLIDRGPFSEKCLRLIEEDWFHSVYGNHEDLMIQCFNQRGHYFSNMWSMNGGGWIEDVSDRVAEELKELVLTLPNTITLYHRSGKKVGICHAQPPTDDWNDLCQLDDRQMEIAIWGRFWINKDKSCGDVKVENVDLTIHGHTIIKEPKKVGNSLFIDTGCFIQEEGYKLTLINIDDYLEGIDGN